MKDLVIKTQGHPMERLLFNADKHRCGTILDGVCLAHENQGGWIIRFTSLRRMYLAACKVRGIKP